jgi:hypothetical protein
MNARNLYRACAIVFVLFAAGHTIGFLTFRPKTAEALAVYDGMRDVHFAFGSTSATWAGLYTGFGLFVTACMLFFACLAWQIGGWSATNPSAARQGGYTLLAVQLANVLICLIYFGAAQVVFNAAVTGLVALALFVSRSRRASGVGSLTSSVSSVARTNPSTIA